MRIAVFADYHGGDRVWPLLEDALEDQRLDLIVFTGDILASEEREEEWQRVLSTGKQPRKKQEVGEEDDVIDELAYREFFVNLTGFGVPVVFVPGHIDAPTARLAEAIRGFPEVHNVETTPFNAADYTFLGRGGAVGPCDADERFYSSQEKTFRKHFAKELDSDPAKTILVVHTPPVSRVDVEPNTNSHLGSQVINEVIDKLQPAFCLCGHVHSAPGQERMGSTLVVNPGAMFRGRYAIIDVEHHRVLFPTPLKV